MVDRLDVWLVDYQRTSELHKTLVDIRFRLLAFVPTVTAVGISVVKDQPDLRLWSGVFGCVVTLALIMYEIRNSQIHDAAAHRLSVLSDSLELLVAGPSGGRPGRQRLFGVILVWHDRALGLIYGASLGAWTALMVSSVPNWPWDSARTAAVVALVVGLAVYEEIIRINRRTKAGFASASTPQAVTGRTGQHLAANDTVPVKVEADDAGQEQGSRPPE